MLAEKHNLVVVLGPTATGKTRLAALLAHAIGAEIISADSRQVYRDMNLGTGKDYEDYCVEGKTIACHLVDIHPAGYKYNVFEFQKDFFHCFEEIQQRKKKVILCGGTGMYLESVTKAYQLISVPVNNSLREKLKDKSLAELENILASYKKLHNKTDTDTVKRAIRAIEIEEYYLLYPPAEKKMPEIKPVYLGIQFDREERRRRISTRLHRRLEEGLVDEVQRLLNQGIAPEDLIYYGLEYKYITQHLLGHLSFSDMTSQLETAIHQFAKRQMTWFRKMEREGVNIHWIDGMLSEEEKIQEALRVIEG
ncbi:MAG: tRNA (adenosine(37)-N6)-dimethylallyltransferase MiaA [Bacteroidota bacterium]|nr:MAG: tRNA (adenosine(37)-N6)-dimethylallyltransferase MiaA [Bacteroidota bacterium]